MPWKEPERLRIMNAMRGFATNRSEKAVAEIRNVFDDIVKNSYRKDALAVGRIERLENLFTS